MGHREMNTSVAFQYSQVHVSENCGYLRNSDSQYWASKRLFI